MSEQRNEMMRLAAGGRDDLRRSRGRGQGLQIGSYKAQARYKEQICKSSHMQKEAEESESRG